MQIQHIDTIRQFENLRSNWDYLYSIDTNASIFVSWSWLRGWIETINDPWFVLCARSDETSPYIGFLPLFHKNTDNSKFHVFRELHMGGNPASDHTGFVCNPLYEKDVIRSLASYVQERLKWDRFHMRDVFDSRLDFFLKSFSQKKFNIIKLDNTPCPFIVLPKNFDQYLYNLGSNTRKKVRRYFKKIDDADEFRVAHVNADNLEKHIDILISLHHLKWKKQQPEHVINMKRTIIRYLFEYNALLFPILYYNDKPIAARVDFIDRKNKTLSAYQSGWDTKYYKISPGNILRFNSIRFAIEKRLKIYDLLRGYEEYKVSSYRANVRLNFNTTIIKSSLKMAIVKNGQRFYNILKKLKNISH